MINYFDFIFKSKMAINRRQSAIVYKSLLSMQDEMVLSCCMQTRKTMFVILLFLRLIVSSFSYRYLIFFLKQILVFEDFPNVFFFIP